jgi:hypothetical protein
MRRQTTTTTTTIDVYSKIYYCVWILKFVFFLQKKLLLQARSKLRRVRDAQDEESKEHQTKVSCFVYTHKSLDDW